MYPLLRTGMSGIPGFPNALVMIIGNGPENLIHFFLLHDLHILFVVATFVFLIIAIAVLAIRNVRGPHEPHRSNPSGRAANWRIV